MDAPDDPGWGEVRTARQALDAAWGTLLDRLLMIVAGDERWHRTAAEELLALPRDEVLAGVRARLAQVLDGGDAGTYRRVAELADRLDADLHDAVAALARSSGDPEVAATAGAPAERTVPATRWDLAGEVAGGDAEGARTYLEGFGGRLAVGRERDTWVLWGGDHVLFEAPARAAVDAFLMGMATSLLPLPEHILAAIREENGV